MIGLDSVLDIEALLYDDLTRQIQEEIDREIVERLSPPKPIIEEIVPIK